MLKHCENSYVIYILAIKILPSGILDDNKTDIFVKYGVKFILLACTT